MRIKSLQSLTILPLFLNPDIAKMILKVLHIHPKEKPYTLINKKFFK